MSYSAIQFHEGIETDSKTITLGSLNANGANEVTVLDVNGEGILLFVANNNANTATITDIQITIDGVEIVSDVAILKGLASAVSTASLPMMLKFNTSCKVEMSLDGAGTTNLQFEAMVIYA